MSVAQHLLTAAMDHHRAGRLSEAEQLYRQILTGDPEHADALHLLGVARTQLGALDNGIALIEQAVRRRPDQAPFRLNLAKAYERAGRPAQAAEAFAAAARLAPESAEAPRALARLHERRGDPDAALAAYAQLEAHGHLRPGERARYADLLYIRRYYRRAAEHYALLADETPVADPRAAAWRLGHANCLYNLKDYAAAIPVYRDAVALRPDDPRAHFNLARTLELSARPDQAEAAYRAAVAADPGHTAAWNGLVMLLAEQGRTAEATRCGQAALTAKDRQACAAFTAAGTGTGTGTGTDASDRPSVHRLAEPAPAFSATCPDRNVISYSLWGADPLYTEGAVANARLTRDLFPGWTCRIYHDATVPVATLSALAEAGARLIAMPDRRSAHEGLFWRFFVSDDPGVDRFLCRDCDCRLSEREREAVAAWIESGRPFHIMRDHIFHAEPILAGLWGGIAGRLPSMRAAAMAWIDPHLGNRWQDQAFLCARVWPLIRSHALIHDRVYRFGPDARDFPSPPAGPSAMRLGDRVPVPALVPPSLDRLS